MYVFVLLTLSNFKYICAQKCDDTNSITLGLTYSPTRSKSSPQILHIHAATIRECSDCSLIDALFNTGSVTDRAKQSSPNCTNDNITTVIF